MNQLTGTIPADLGRLQNLQLLHLFQNNLTGAIPPSLGGLLNLREIDISINQLSGGIPVQFQTLPNLTDFMMAENNLTGKLPPLLGKNSTRLSSIDLSENGLSGRIPETLCQNKNLTRLSLAKNKLEGTIPEGLKNCFSLTFLDIHQNWLSSEIPPELGLLTNITYLDLSYNKFQGEIPAAFGNLSELVYLIVSGSELSGGLPSTLGNLSKLLSFNASRNRIDGMIPVELANCKSLNYLDLSHNRLTGNIPYQFGYLTNLIALDIGYNFLSGEIPPELGNLAKLSNPLSLRFNNLTGGIPSELASLSLLISLYVDHNQLAGEIPSSFSNSTNLIVFNVSYNRLEGPIPNIFARMNLDNLAGNLDLCGTPLDVICSNPQEENGTNSKEVIVQTIVGVVVGISGLTIIALILAIFCIWRRGSPARKGFRGMHDLDNGRSDTESSCSFFETDANRGFTFQDILEATRNFSPECIVGSGACGTVYMAKLPSGKLIAVKRVPTQMEGSAMQNSFNAEIATLGTIRHSNIVKLYGYCYHQEANLLLYEYMPMGSLGEHLHGKGGSGESVNNADADSPTIQSLDWDTRYRIALGSAEGLAYLHHDCKPSIIHRDIKCNNILLDNKMKAHVGDFGLAKIMDVPFSISMSAVAGSYGYIAPEYAYSMKITNKCDVYSFGVVLLELLTGQPPVLSLENGGDLVTWVRTSIAVKKKLVDIFDSRLNLGNETTLHEMISVLRIALLCTSLGPTDRPTMREVVHMLSGVRRETHDVKESLRMPETQDEGILHLASQM
ncbi:hypothetical protein KP509_07G061200 [Ceratopteris richardii]|nr:hypothetical protein KP509_07G061200 [Ceratopteris richardii]